MVERSCLFDPVHEAGGFCVPRAKHELEGGEVR